MKVVPVFLTIGIFQVALPIREKHFLISEEQYLAYYVRDIVYQQFEQGQSVLVSWIRDAPEETNTQRMLAQGPSNTDRTSMVYFLLQTFNHMTRWPLQISCVGAQKPEIIADDFVKHHGYIIFTWAEEGQDDVMGNLIDQMEETKDSPLWNPRGRFLIVVVGHRSQNAALLALDIAEELWKNYKVSNVLLLIPKVSTKFHQSTQSLYSNNIPLTFGLYTWIPYQSHKTCAKVNVFMIEELKLDGKQRLLKKQQAHLLSDKIPRQFHGCPLRVSIIDTPPALVVINNTSRIPTGVEVQYFQQLAQAANVTVMYQEAPPGDAVEIRLQRITDLEAGSADLAFGGFPLHPMAAAFADPTIWHLDDVMVWYVPCGVRNDRMERVMAIFTPPLWAAICIVFVLVVIVMWAVVNITRFTQPRGLRTSTSVLNSISIAWAVTLGVSVPDVPRNDTSRTIFLSAVWYSFAISAYFRPILQVFS